MTTKAHLTVTGKHVPLNEFIDDHSHAIDLGHFFSVAVPVPRKFANDEGYKIEEWGTPKQPQVTVIREKQPLEHPKDFSLDEIVYEFQWAEHLVSPPNRWLERASELYELAMLLEFSNGDVITILETSSNGEITLDKELDKAAALEFFDLQEKLHGYKPPTVAPTLKDVLELHRPSGSEKIAQLLLDVLTEEELRLTLHKYANDVRKKQEAERQAKWEETKRADPYWSHHYKKQAALVNYQANRKAAGDKGAGALAEFEVSHQDLICSTGSDKGLTTDYAQMAKNLYYSINLREFFDRITLEGDALRTVEFRKALARVKKNWKDRERKAAKREERYKADKAHNDKVLPTEVPKLSWLDFTTPAINVNDLISDEAKSFKGDK